MTPATRILHLAPCSPIGSASGVQMRVSQIATALQEVGQVDSVVVSYNEERTTELHEGGLRVRRIIKLRPISIRSPWERLRCGIDPRFINYQGHAVADKDRMFVLNELPKYDLVWFHYLITANVFDQWHWPRSVMDLADIPSSFFRTAWQPDNSLGQRLRANFRMQVARARERVLGERFNVFAVCSNADREYLGLRNNVHVIPNGFAKPEGEPSRQISTPPRIGFIGVRLRSKRRGHSMVCREMLAPD